MVFRCPCSRCCHMVSLLKHRPASCPSAVSFVLLHWLWTSQPQHPHHNAPDDLGVWYNPGCSISVSLSLKDERTLSFLRSAPPSVPWVGDVLFRGNMHLVMHMNLVISRFHCMYLLSSGHCGRGTWLFLWNSRPTAELLFSKFPCNQW